MCSGIKSRPPALLDVPCDASTCPPHSFLIISRSSSVVYERLYVERAESPMPLFHTIVYSIEYGVERYNLLEQCKLSS